MGCATDVVIARSAGAHGKHTTSSVSDAIQVCALRCPEQDQQVAVESNLAHDIALDHVSASEEIIALQAQVKSLQAELEDARAIMLQSRIGTSADVSSTNSGEGKDREDARRERGDVEKMWKAVLMEAGPFKLQILQDRDRVARALAEAEFETRRRCEFWEEVREEVDRKTYTAIVRTFEALGGDAAAGPDGDKSVGLPVQAKLRLFETSTPIMTHRRAERAQTPRIQRRHSVAGPSSEDAAPSASTSTSAPLISRLFGSAVTSRGVQLFGPRTTTSTAHHSSVSGSVDVCGGEKNSTMGSVAAVTTGAAKSADICQHGGHRAASTPSVGVAPAPAASVRSVSSVRARIRALESEKPVSSRN
eukprot:TRINITY_DN8305_c0_g1_i1.p1 TRINITY_DN8305_c0_g1~~TRINITY_DN8305_c0_g1_i1.p1  ORF type:complete len:362 (+),score=60.68 TRINITY_DN8305_c0_g1_i1:66-1151(+)